MPREEGSSGVEGKPNSLTLGRNLTVCRCCSAELPEMISKSLIAFQSLPHYKAALPVFWVHLISMTQLSVTIKGLHCKHLAPAISSGHLLLLYFTFLWLFSPANLSPRSCQCTCQLVSLCSGFRNWMCCTNGINTECGSRSLGTPCVSPVLCLTQSMNFSDHQLKATYVLGTGLGTEALIVDKKVLCWCSAEQKSPKTRSFVSSGGMTVVPPVSPKVGGVCLQTTRALS